jgi:hypothetical protein
MAPFDVPTRFAMPKPVEVIGNRISLNTLDDNINEPCVQKYSFQALPSVQHQMLAPQREILERFEVQKVEQKVSCVGNFNNARSSNCHTIVSISQNSYRVKQVLYNVKACHEVEIVIVFFARNVGNVGKYRVTILLHCDTSRGLRLHGDNVRGFGGGYVKDPTRSGSDVKPFLAN